MRIAPYKVFSPSVQPPRIAVGDVHSPRVADAPVDDDVLAVVAVVGVDQVPDPALAEHAQLHAPLLHGPPVEGAAVEVDHAVHQHADFHALRGLAGQDLRHPQRGLVLGEDEELEMDVVPGLLQVGEQVFEHRVEIGVDAHVVAF